MFSPKCVPVVERNGNAKYRDRGSIANRAWRFRCLIRRHLFERNFEHVGIGNFANVGGRNPQRGLVDNKGTVGGSERIVGVGHQVGNHGSDDVGSSGGAGGGGAGIGEVSSHHVGGIAALEPGDGA